MDKLHTELDEMWFALRSVKLETSNQNYLRGFVNYHR